MLIDIARRISIIALVITAILSAAFFPWSTDSPLTTTEHSTLETYYAVAYSKPDQATGNDDNSPYVKIAKEAAESMNIRGAVRSFVDEYSLRDGKVLDIGAGRGYLQDLVEDYTALDISPSAKRFFHKRFVHGSATLMPLPSNEFDAAWSIWVLEHVPNPEAALVEMRRVVKNGGLLLLHPAWNCTPYKADGYSVRPYSDFGLDGKLVKFLLPTRLFLWRLSRPPVRTLRRTAWKVTGHPTQFRYRRLTPNYEQYWEADSDAVNSLDRDETAMWFQSRGDECLNCETSRYNELDTLGPLIIRIRK